MRLFDINGFPISEDICHHGIKGQKWGVRRYQNPDGSLTKEGYKRYAEKNLRKAKQYNMDKWGKDPKHNTLFITGYSGSGKSTVAKHYENTGASIIHLDAYSEGISSIQNKRLNKMLNVQVPKWKDMGKSSKKGSSEYWDTVDSFRRTLEMFSEQEFTNGRKVVVEGVQISNDWLAINKEYYKDKPMVILQTPAIKSIHRRFERDGVVFDETTRKHLKRYYEDRKQLNDLESIMK